MLYQHYKGGLYRKLFEATEEATGQTIVIYVSLKDGKTWTRPKESFEEMISNPFNARDGKNPYTPRFRLLEE